MLQMHQSTVAYKNILKAWSFTKNVLQQGWFGVSLQKIFWENVFGNCTGQVLLMTNGRLMLRQLNDLNFKWRFHLYLLSERCLCLIFKNYYYYLKLSESNKCPRLHERNIFVPVDKKLDPAVVFLLFCYR